MIHAPTIHPSALSPEDVTEWRALCAADPTLADPLVGPDFALAVGAVRDDARVLVMRDAHGRPDLFWAYHLRPGGLARPIGAPFSDYHGVAVRAGSTFHAHEVLAAAGVRRFAFEGLVGARSPFAACASAAKPIYAISLESTADAYLETLRNESPKRFKNMRRLANKLEREVGEISLTAPDTDREAFDAVMGWKRTQFRTSGLHDVLAPDWVRDLMDGLFERREGPMTGLLITLRAGGRVVAGHFGVRAGDVFHPWIASFDPAMSPYGPGVTLISTAIRAMPELGLRTYDLSGGHDHYKKPFTAGDAVVAQGIADVRPRASRAVPGASALDRLGRRLDQIAAVEPSMRGRLRGVLGAVVAIPKRLGAGGATAAAGAGD